MPTEKIEQGNNETMIEEVTTTEMARPTISKPTKRRVKQRTAGQIITRGENRHLIRVFLGRDANGKRRYHNHTLIGTKKDAQKWLTGALRRRDLGEPVEQSTMHFDEYLDQWLEMVVKTRVRERTYDDYSGIIERHIKPALGKKRLADIGAFDIQKLYSSMQSKGLSGKTAKGAHILIKDALRQAVAWEKIRLNPADKVDAPKVTKREMHAMSPEQARAFLKATEGDRNGPMFAFALTTGTRPEEYFALKWSDLDWQARSVTIRRALVWRYKPPRWYFAEPKTPSSYRTLPLNESIMRKLEERQAQQVKDRALAGDDWEDNGLIFPKADGGPFELATCRLFYQRILMRAELPTNFRVYDLRHTCATILLSQNVHPKIVSERLGHASIAITLQIYSHVLPNMQSEATEQLEKALFSDVGAL